MRAQPYQPQWKNRSTNKIKVNTIDLTLNVPLTHLILTNITQACNFEYTDFFTTNSVECEHLAQDFKYPLEDLISITNDGITLWL